MARRASYTYHRITFPSYRSVGKYITFTIVSVAAIYYGLCNLLPYFRFHKYRKSLSDSGLYLIRTEGCRIAEINPWDQSVIRFYENVPNEAYNCYEDPLILVEDFNKMRLNSGKVKRMFGEVEPRCIYRTIRRNPKVTDKRPDDTYKVGEAQTLVFGNPMKDEFLQVECYRPNGTMLFEEYVALMVLKPEVEKRCDQASKKNLGPDSLNVILLSIDSVSKLNFLRHFPNTYNFLRNDIKLFEFHGYVKVADNTFPNMVPFLAGHFVDEYGGDEAFANILPDTLPLIWKEFSHLGYRTFYVEDTPPMHTFTYGKRGFYEKPTDYYMRVFQGYVENTRWRSKNGHYCFGYLPESTYFYDYTLKFMKLMKDKPFFSWTFLVRASHNNLNMAGLHDGPTYDIFRRFKESGILNTSAVIFFSDHGIRYGDIRKTYVGKIEDRMPFMFQYYPDWFLQKYPDFKRSLTINQRRLTTAFDVHKTLQDIVTLSSKNKTEYFKKINPGLGQSLFTEIPSNRTCKSAHIPRHWCTCNELLKVSDDDEILRKLSQCMVDTINDWTNSTQEDSPCAHLTVDEVVDAYISVPQMLMTKTKSKSSSKMSFQPSVREKIEVADYLITVKASPSFGIFEGTVRSSRGKISVLGDISRINKYEGQSWCQTVHRLEKFCFCKSSVSLI